MSRSSRPTGFRPPRVTPSSCGGRSRRSSRTLAGTPGRTRQLRQTRQARQTRKARRGLIGGRRGDGRRGAARGIQRHPHDPSVAVARRDELTAVGRDGEVLARYAPNTEPADIADDIRAALASTAA